MEGDKCRDDVQAQGTQGSATVGDLGAPRAAHHLEHVGDGEVNVATELAVKELCALDDDQPGWEVHPPGESRGTDQHLDLARQKEGLHGGPVVVVEAGVVQPHAVKQRVPQCLEWCEGGRDQVCCLSTYLSSNQPVFPRR